MITVKAAVKRGSFNAHLLGHMLCVRSVGVDGKKYDISAFVWNTNRRCKVANGRRRDCFLRGVMFC